MGKYAYLATSALVVNFMSFSTLVWNIYKTKNTSSMNWLSLIGNLFSQILMTIYAFLNGAPEIYVFNTFFIAGLIYMIYVKYHYHYYDEQNY